MILFIHLKFPLRIEETIKTLFLNTLKIAKFNLFIQFSQMSILYETNPNCPRYYILLRMFMITNPVSLRHSL